MARWSMRRVAAFCGHQLEMYPRTAAVMETIEALYLAPAIADALRRRRVRLTRCIN